MIPDMIKQTRLQEKTKEPIYKSWKEKEKKQEKKVKWLERKANWGGAITKAKPSDSCQAKINVATNINFIIFQIGTPLKDMSTEDDLLGQY